MAKIVGCITTSHIPAIGGAIAKNLKEEDYWKPFFDGFPPVHEWLKKVKPDVAIVIYNDHGLNFFLDKMPTFSIGAAPQYHNADEGWGIPTLSPSNGDPALSWHIIDELVAKEFDLTTCQEMLVDHAVALPLKLLWPNDDVCPVRIVPVCINTVQHPLPSAQRCYKLGKAIGEAIESLDEDLRVVIIGTGGLSHQLEGERAGFINKEFDLKFMDSMISNPTWATQFSNEDLVEQTGSQGIELLMWVSARAALPGDARLVHSNYHIPISNTAAGLMVMEGVNPS